MPQISDLLWSLAVLHKESELAGMIVKRLDDPTSEAPFITRYASRYSKQLLDAHLYGIALSPSTVESLKTSDTAYFERFTSRFRTFSEIKKSAESISDPYALPQGLKFETGVSVGGVCLPLFSKKQNLAIDIDTGIDGYSFRVRKEVLRKLKIKYIVISDRMWKASTMANTADQFIKQTIIDNIRGAPTRRF